ncbi:MAG: uroporphyrinogen-III C-methyltransferase [Candidatus Glassbacteria bacterium]|nr:uroporphyrinogen-III C-methyltransferase [Candidatus Glassbacteria bacterium]
MAENKGRIILVGSGPGDPKLITVRGLEALRCAEVLIYDNLAPNELLAEVPADCEVIYVGKKTGSHTMAQEEINRLLVAKAKEAKLVVRLKGGDPFVFGRGGEEALEALADGVPFEVVPGVTAGVAVPAYAGIPVTQRGINVAVTFVTGHEDPGKDESAINWQALAAGEATLVFYMGVGNLGKISRRLIDNGRPDSTPVAVIHRGTTRSQRTVTGTLADIESVVREARIKPPSIIIVGEVVALRDKLSWFENRPLFGRKVIVTRAREQASDFSRLLYELGAAVIELPTIKIGPSPDPDAVGGAVAALGTYDWIVFTSVNGVTTFLERIRESGGDIRSLGGAKLCAIGPATAAALESLGLRVEVVPETYLAEEVVNALKAAGEIKGKRILLPRAEIARKVLPDSLREYGAEVDEVPVYSTQAETPENLDDVKRDLEAGEIDVITFTSSSTVENFIELVGESAARQAVAGGTLIAAIGPVTAERAAGFGLEAGIVPGDYTVSGLAGAIAAHFRTK